MTDYEKMTDDELSAAVAERVMGWWRPADVSDWRMFDERIADDDWSPATDWSDAGRVLEKMRADGWWYAIVCAPPGSDFGVMVVFTKGAATACAQCPAEPRAICIAALRAVEARA